MTHNNLNEQILRKYCEDIKKKKTPAINEPDLIKEFLTYVELNHEYLKKANAYEVASNIRSFSTWYLNKDIEPNKRHIAKHRDVYYVDLGSFNLKYESGFIHPCIIIRRYGSNVLVIPCSSKKYGKQDDLIFDIPKGDVFRDNTGALLDQVRNISITRLKSKIGQVSEDIFDNLINQLVRKYFCKHYNNFENLKIKSEKLRNQVNMLHDEINTKNYEISNLQEQISNLEKKLLVSK